MDGADATTRILTGLARAREAMLELAHRLQARADVVSVVSQLDARMYRDALAGGGPAPCIELYVEAELDTGNSVCWWLDVRQAEDGWIAEPSIFVQHSTGQAPLAEMAPRPLRTDAEFADALNEVVAALISNADRHLDAARAWTAS